MVADNSNDFQRYLESIGTAYKDWWSLYTLTDAVGKQQVEREKSSSVFDFGLMVQRVKPEQPERGEAQEKTERLPVLEGLQKYASDHVLLVGRPGSGKSTALARLLLEEATKPLPEAEKGVKSPPSLVGKGVGGLDQIPVLVELRQYKTSVLDLIREFLLRHRLRLDSREIETLLFEGRFLLLIDGLNELPSEEARRDLKAFRQNYGATSMIFTTRDLGVGGDLGIEKKLEMQPLTEVQMQQFVRAYLPEQGDLMLRQLRNRLREMGQTPLLLWMLCELFRQTGNIPPNLGLVFRCFAQNYDRKIKGDVPVSEELRRWLPESLQHLALVMMQGETPTELRVTISRREAEAVLTTFLQGKVAYPANRAKEWLEDLLEHHLIQLDSSHQIEFRHQLLQEYYAAESLLQRLPQISDDRLKRDYLNYLKWTEPLALMLALVDDEAEAIRVVNLALAVDLQLGARLAGEVQPTLQKKTVGLVIALDVPQLLKIEFLGITRSNCVILTLRQALNDEDSWVRRRAAVALGKIGNPEAVAVLIQALNDEDSWVRRNTANALEKIGSEAAVEALRIALNHEDSFIRMRAALALGNISSEAAVEVLRSALNDENASVRTRTVSALREIGSEAEVEIVRSDLNSEDFSVRRRAASMLGEIRFRATVEIMLSVLQDRKSNVPRKAASALGKISCETEVEVLRSALNDKNSSVRRRAAWRLGAVGSEAEVEVLLSVLNNDENASVCWSAAWTLGKIASSAILPYLIELLRATGESCLVDTIIAIQERCKYYNYEIATSTPPQEENNLEPLKAHLDMQQYDEILSVISNMVAVMERNPKTFQKIEEEALRDHFLVQLNGKYKGQATGETFNGNGKTDILIRVEGKNIFIAECKFWGGEKKLKETLDQLLGYTTWRDTKLALLIFNRRKNFTAVLKQIPEVIKNHPNFTRKTPYPSETGFRFELHHPDDKNRELLLTVLAFDIPQ